MVNIGGKQFFHGCSWDAKFRKCGEPRLVSFDQVKDFYKEDGSYFARIVICTGFVLKICDTELLEMLKQTI